MKPVRIEHEWCGMPVSAEFIITGQEYDAYDLEVYAPDGTDIAVDLLQDVKDDIIAMIFYHQVENMRYLREDY